MHWNPLKMESTPWMKAAFVAVIAAALAWVALPGGFAAKEIKPLEFATPDAAVQAFVDAVRKGDLAQVLKILGPAGQDIMGSGDPVADEATKKKFLDAFDQKHAIVKKSDAEAELVLGSDDWPFPIPIVQEKKKWIFDTEAGKEEILNRRIGRNEIKTIEVLEAYVHAQREYYRLDYDEDGVPEYAQKLMSSEGQHDGLFWPVEEGEDPSPLGPLVADAAAEGYKKRDSGPAPYHGYYYKILTAQGPDAPGGAYSYIINGNMVAGFAAMAWPAEWDNSGLMTFVVNANGIIYEKDLGEKTAEIAQAMNAYNADGSWKRAK